MKKFRRTAFNAKLILPLEKVEILILTDDNLIEPYWTGGVYEDGVFKTTPKFGISGEINAIKWVYVTDFKSKRGV